MRKRADELDFMQLRGVTDPDTDDGETSLTDEDKVASVQWDTHGTRHDCSEHQEI